MSKRSIKIKTLEEKLNANLNVSLNTSENHQAPVEEIIPDYINEDGPCTEGDPQDVPCENAENDIDYWSMAVNLFNDKIIPLFETSTHYHYMVKNNVSMDESIDRFYQIISAVFKKYNVTNIDDMPNDVITAIKMEVKEFNNKHKLFFKQTLTQELNKLFPYKIQFNVNENILSNISDKKVYNLIKETLFNIKNNVSSNNLFEEYNIIINNIFPNETFTDVEMSTMYSKIKEYVENTSIYYLEPDAIAAHLKGLYLETPKELNDNEIKELLETINNKREDLKKIKRKLTHLDEAIKSLPKESEWIDTLPSNIEKLEEIMGPPHQNITTDVLESRNNTTDEVIKNIKDKSKEFNYEIKTVKDKHAKDIYFKKINNNDILNEATNNIVNNKSMDYENVDHPTHYNNYDVEAIDMMEKIWGPEETAIFCKLNAFKYRMRMGTKPDNSIQQDLKKEHWYIEKYHNLKNKIN